jgi:hypothetical protein
VRTSTSLGGFRLLCRAFVQSGQFAKDGQIHFLSNFLVFYLLKGIPHREMAKCKISLNFQNRLQTAYYYIQERLPSAPP